jgi:hypothetical protein
VMRVVVVCAVAVHRSEPLVVRVVRVGARGEAEHRAIAVPLVARHQQRAHAHVIAQAHVGACIFGLCVCITALRLGE